MNPVDPVTNARFIAPFSPTERIEVLLGFMQHLEETKVANTKAVQSSASEKLDSGCLRVGQTLQSIVRQWITNNAIARPLAAFR